MVRLLQSNLISNLKAPFPPLRVDTLHAFCWGIIHPVPSISKHCQMVERNAFRCKTRRWWPGSVLSHSRLEMGPPGLVLCLVMSLATPPHSAGGLCPCDHTAWWLMHLQASCSSSRQGWGSKGRKGLSTFLFRKGHLPQRGDISWGRPMSVAMLASRQSEISGF